MSLRMSTLIILTALLTIGCNQATTTNTDSAEITEAATNNDTAASTGNDSAPDHKGNFSYALGVGLGNQLKQLLDANAENNNRAITISAISDVINENALTMTEEELQATLQAGPDAITNDEEKDKFSYAMGIALSSQLMQVLDANAASIDRPTTIEALVDALNDKELKMTEEEVQIVLNAERARQEAEASEIAAKMAEAGAAFLAQNKTQQGWNETASGLQYKTVTEGTGASPTAEQTVKVHYAGTLTDGKQFDSSYERGEPVEFPLNGVIPGWTEGLQLMKVGGKTEFAIPSDLAYGPQGRPSIPPNSVLLFTVELLEIK